LQTPVWRQALTDCFTDLPSLLAYLRLDETLLPTLWQPAHGFNLRVPKGFVDLMRPGDPHDPLLRQVLPLALENAGAPGFTQDPVGDQASESVPGLLHKYRGRALVVATGACAVHCRYCFRRHYPYAEGSAPPRRWAAILDYLHAHPELEEVILSGGDPLMVSDGQLAGWVQQLAALPRLKRLRLHTRLPVVLPQRVTPELVEHLAGSRLQTLVVIHANHPNELSQTVASALARFKEAGLQLLNQSVLLKGVNDNTDTLARLSERLFECGVLPYYLHLLDRVAGAAHFEVDEAQARTLLKALQGRLPGYLVPRLVREIAGECAKTPVAYS
jgi:EF-P beta-lysylation protein EpmB